MINISKSAEHKKPNKQSSGPHTGRPNKMNTYFTSTCPNINDKSGSAKRSTIASQHEPTQIRRQCRRNFAQKPVKFLSQPTFSDLWTTAIPPSLWTQHEQLHQSQYKIICSKIHHPFSPLSIYSISLRTSPSFYYLFNTAFYYSCFFYLYSFFSLVRLNWLSRSSSLTTWLWKVNLPEWIRSC